MCVCPNPCLAHVVPRIFCEVILQDVQVNEVWNAWHEFGESTQTYVSDFCFFEVEVCQSCACRQHRRHKAVEKAVSEAIAGQIQASEICAL